MHKINRTRGIAPAIIAIIIAILAIGGGVGINQVNKNAKIKKEKEGVEQQAKLATSTPQTLKIFLNEQNGSGETGEAELISMGTTTKVIVNLVGKPSEVSQPSHIHLGTCATIGAVKYPLSNIEKGASQTILAVTLQQLIAEAPLALNVHKSATEIGIYTACGNIATSTPRTKESDDSEDSKKSAVKNVIHTTAGFSPNSMTIKKDETVTFTNQSDDLMWVASAPHPQHTDYPAFDEKQSVPRGGIYTFTFDKAGTWKYHNHLNPTRYGTIIVE